MYFLGIDPATQSTGYCVMNENKDIIEKGKIVYPIDEDNEIAKIHYAVSQIEEVILKYNIKYALCEDQFFGQNIDTLKKLSRVVGGYLLLAGNLNINIETIYPSSWRKLFHGYGKASKKDTFNKVVSIFELDDLKFTKDNDITDSVGICWACVDLWKEKAS